jgi:hypothetical protein
VAADAGAPGRPPAGRRGLPPHVPAFWQGAWMSGRSSARRRSAWRPDRSPGTPPWLWPYPSASAARNSRSHRSDSRRWPPESSQGATVGGLEATRQAMPMHPRGQETAHGCFSMAAAGTAWIHSAIRAPRERRLLASPESSLLSAEQACDTPHSAAAPAGSIGSASRPGQPGPRQPGARAPNGRLALVVCLASPWAPVRRAASRHRTPAAQRQSLVDRGSPSR